MLAGLAALPAATGIAARGFPATPQRAGVMAANDRVKFGTAIRPDQLAMGGAIETHVRRDCDLLVPEFHGQWSAVEWIEGQPWHGNYDAIVDYAAVTGKAVRGHSLLWEQMTPDWARHALGRSADWGLVRRHFADLVPRYSGRIGEWIVVNEMIDTEAGDSGFRRTTFQRAFGNDYVARALETAREFDPVAKLMINDYSLCQDNPVDAARRGAMLRLVESLKTRGAPLDCVGIQGHLELAKGPIPKVALAAFLSDLAGMGVELAITELDVLEDDRHRPLTERDAAVAAIVEDYLGVVTANPAVKSIVTWGLSDAHSWLQDKAPDTSSAQSCSPVDCYGLNRGLPYDGRMRAKPMQRVIEQALA